MLPAHASVIHAVLMHGLQAFIQKHVCDILYTPENLRRSLVVILARLEAHHPYVFCADTFHARNGAADFRERDFKRVIDLLGPIHNSGTEAIDANIGSFERFNRSIKCRVMNVMKVGLRIDRKSTRLNSSHGYISY